jgi:hypothetical protein
MPEEYVIKQLHDWIKAELQRASSRRFAPIDMLNNAGIQRPPSHVHGRV